MNTATRSDPARDLYEFWESLLERYAYDTCAWGPVGWGVWRHELTGGIAYGMPRGWRNPHFVLLNDGRFRLTHMHGTYRRDGLAKGTFLGYGWTHSRYQWFVDLGDKHSGWRGRYREKYREFLTDWREPVPYVSEDLLGIRVYNQPNPWTSLREQNDVWEIIPAADQLTPGDTALLRASLEQEHLWKRWDHYAGIVARRRRQAENAHRVKIGLEPKVSARVPILKSGSQVLSPDQAVQQLVALLDVQQPAKITPMRPKEAPDGADNLAAPLHH